MQSQIKSRTTVSESETKIEVRTQTGRWQQPEVVKLKQAFVPSQSCSFFHNVILPGSGVPFSPLND